MNKIVSVLKSRKFLIAMATAVLAGGVTALAIKKAPEIEVFVSDELDD